MKKPISHLFFTFCLGFLALMVQNCTSAKTAKDNYPAPIDYPTYELVDARHETNISLDVKQNDKVAIVVRDLAVTAFSNIENPKYDSKIIKFEKADHCCVPNNGMMGSTGLMVYKFKFLKKGITTIKIIARHKGLSMDAAHFDSDIVTTVKVSIN